MTYSEAASKLANCKLRIHVNPLDAKQCKATHVFLSMFTFLTGFERSGALKHWMNKRIPFEFYIHDGMLSFVSATPFDCNLPDETINILDINLSYKLLNFEALLT